MKKIVNINLHFFHYYICIIYKMSIVVDNWKVQEDRKIWISWKFFLSCFTFLWENTTSFLPSFISPIIDQPDTQKHKFFSKLVSLLFSIAAPNNHPNQSHAIKASKLELRFLTTPYCCDWFRYLLFMDRFFIEVLAPCAGTMFTIKCRPHKLHVQLRFVIGDWKSAFSNKRWENRQTQRQIDPRFLTLESMEYILMCKQGLSYHPCLFNVLSWNGPLQEATCDYCND